MLAISPIQFKRFDRERNRDKCNVDRHKGREKRKKEGKSIEPYLKWLCQCVETMMSLVQYTDVACSFQEARYGVTMMCEALSSRQKKREGNILKIFYTGMRVISVQ